MNVIWCVGHCTVSLLLCRHQTLRILMKDLCNRNISLPLGLIRFFFALFILLHVDHQPSQKNLSARNEPSSCCYSYSQYGVVAMHMPLRLGFCISSWVACIYCYSWTDSNNGAWESCTKLCWGNQAGGHVPV